MKEMELLLKTVSDGLRILAQGAEVIADKLEAFAEQGETEAPPSAGKDIPVHDTADEQAVKKRPRKTPGPRAARARKAAHGSDRVYEAMSQAGGPVGLDELAEKTGLNKKQVHNALYKLKKQGRVENVGKAVYKTVG